MIRLYYDCPIEAVYMAENFNILFYILRREEGTLFWKKKSIDAKGILSTYKDKRVEGLQFFVSQDSFDILKPKKGDLLEYESRFNEFTEELEPYCLGCGENIKHFDEFTSLEEVKRIIQRNNKSFIMPKTEI